MKELESAKRLIRDIHGGNLELPESQLEDVRTLCLHVIQKADIPHGPAFHGSTNSPWPSQTEYRFGDL